ncbi:MAG TPA: class I SAM-dependent methyltransferase [Candidatus Limnocylindrales bacterium]|nr:class I SAM-dependent methyltransferase [Candidatus Limnocylindrales bacterium]
MADRDEQIAVNRALWDRWTAVHARSEYYDLDAFRAGEARLPDFEVAEVGDVRGKRLVHLMCHLGVDTLCWAKLGAKATGLDISERSVEVARALAGELGIDAEFVAADVNDARDVLDGNFDVVYTSRGILGWLPDLTAWAGVIRDLLAPGGIFYMHEIHPFYLVFDLDSPELKVTNPYFPRAEPARVRGSYAGADEGSGEPGYAWVHGLGEIVSAIGEADLQIEFLHEFRHAEGFMAPSQQREFGDMWLPEDLEGEVPVSFSLRARNQA